MLLSTRINKIILTLFLLHGIMLSLTYIFIFTENSAAQKYYIRSIWQGIILTIISFLLFHASKKYFRYFINKTSSLIQKSIHSLVFGLILIAGIFPLFMASQFLSSSMVTDRLEERIYFFTIRSGQYLRPEMYNSNEEFEKSFLDAKSRFTIVVKGNNKPNEINYSFKDSFFIRKFLINNQMYFWVFRGIGPLFNLPDNAAK